MRKPARAPATPTAAAAPVAATPAPSGGSSLSEDLTGGAREFFEVLHWITLVAAVRFVADKAHSLPIVVLSNVSMIVVFLGVLGVCLAVSERMMPGAKLTHPGTPKEMAYLVASGAAAMVIMLLVWLFIDPTIDALALSPH